MSAEKDLELLGEGPNPRRSDSIVERIARLQRELARGEMVYTAAEIQTLERQLEEYEHLLEVIQHR